MIRPLLSLPALAVAAIAMLTGPVAAQDDYRLGPGDTLRVEVLEDPSLNRTVLVAPDGRIALPLAGGVSAAGRSLESVQADIAAKLGPNFATAPNVYVALERQREARPATGGGSAALAGVEIFVMGEAAKPGRLEVTRGTTVLQLFAQMGGFTKFAATKRIQLRRGGQIWNLNYKAIEAGTSDAGATVLADGDVIVVPQRKLFE